MDQEAAIPDDPVVKTLDNLLLLQYPLRPKTLPYDNVEHLSSKFKPKQQKLEMELAINTRSPNYCKSKGQQIAVNVDGVAGDEGLYSSGRMDKQLLQSMPMGVKGNYAAAVVHDNTIHITPIQGVLQMRPSFQYLDKADDKIAAPQPEPADEAEEPTPIHVRFARRETDDAKSRRLASFDHHRRQMADETWIDVAHHNAGDPVSVAERSYLFARNVEDTSEFEMACTAYRQKILAKPEDRGDEHASLPSNVVSMSELRSKPLKEQVHSLLMNAQVIRFNQLMTLLPRGTEQAQVLRALQEDAMLVQGCWVVKSELLYPPGTFSPNTTGVSSESLCTARDYIMWRFRHNKYLVRKEIHNAVKVPHDDLKSILEGLARPRVRIGWEFMCDFDNEFERKFPEIVQRQTMHWDAKFQQLMRSLKIAEQERDKLIRKAMSPERPGSTVRARMRTHSRSRTASGPDPSDQSDSEDVKPRVRRLSGRGEGDADHVEGRSRQRRHSGRSRHGSGAAAEVSLEQLPPPAALKKEDAPTNTSIRNLTAELADCAALNPVPMDTGAAPELLSLAQLDSTAKEQLVKFAQERLRSRYVLTRSELRRQFSLFLAASPPGHPLTAGVVTSVTSGVRQPVITGVTDDLLGEAAMTGGAMKLGQTWPSDSFDEDIYIWAKTGDSYDVIRDAIVTSFKSQYAVTLRVIKKNLDPVASARFVDDDIRKVLRQMCTMKRGSWYLKGTMRDT